MTVKGLILFLGIFFCLSGCWKESPGPKGVLFDFEQDQDLDAFWWKCRTRFSISEKYARHGRGSLEISFFPTGQVGFSTDQIEHDWRHTSALVFFVHNPSPVQIPFYLQISDDLTKGEPLKAFRKQIIVVPGESRIVIPVEELKDASSRALDVRNIKGFYIFMKDIKTKTTLYFDYFTLVG